MVHFAFSEEQELFRQSVREFAQQELAPGYLKRAKSHEPPWDVVAKLRDQGLVALNVPEEYGGQGADHVTLGIAVEEISRADFNAVFCNAIIGPLLQGGTPEQKQRWLPPMTTGDCILALALTEPHCGSDAAALRTSAVRDGDEYVLNGEKTSISLAWGHGFFVYAKTDPQAGPRGVTCFLVPRESPGLTVSYFQDMGCRPLGRGSLNFKDVRVPAANRIGDEGMGFKMVMGEFDYIRVLLSMQCLGAAQASLEEAIAYAKDRTAFGKPIARFEGVSFLIAEHATLIEAGRLMAYKALWLRDRGLPHTKEAAMVKWWVPRLTAEAIKDCLLIHGHLGYSDEFPLEQRLRDVMGFQLADGTAQIQKIVVAREVMGRESLPY